MTTNFYFGLADDDALDVVIWTVAPATPRCPVKTRRFFSLQPSISISAVLEASEEELEREK